MSYERLSDEPTMLNYIEQLMAKQQPDFQDWGATATVLRYHVNSSENKSQIHVAVRTGTRLYRLRCNITHYGAYIRVHTETFEQQSGPNGTVVYKPVQTIYEYESGEAPRRPNRQIIEVIDTAILQCSSSIRRLTEAKCLVS